MCALLCSCGHETHDHNHNHNHNHNHDHGTEAHAHVHNHSHKHDAKADAHNHGAEKAHEGEHSDEIVMSVEQAKNAGVKVSKVAAGTFHNVINASGHIVASQSSETSVVANMTGVISMPRPITEGKKVSKGEVLFTISADKLQDGDPAQKAKVAYEAAKEEYERAERLLGKQLVTKSEFIAIKERYENARIAYEAMGSKNGKVTVTAPADGYIYNCTVSPGSFVSTGQLLAGIAKTNRLYLQAEVPMRHSKAVGSITSAQFITEYSDEVFDTQNLNGKLLSIGKTASPASAYLPVTFEIDNSGDLIAGTFVTVHLLSSERQNVITLPLSAITEQQGINFVYIQNDATCYSKREVRLGMSDGKRVEILSGLHIGENVVTEGAIHVRLASVSSSIPGHSHNH